MGEGASERAWSEDMNVPHSTIYPSTSVPKRSLLGRDSPHSSLSTAQARFSGLCSQAHCKGGNKGQGWGEQLGNARGRLLGRDSWEENGGDQSGRHLKAES